MFGQGMFTIDPNATPDQVARKRQMIAALLPRFGSAKYVGEGIGQLATGVMAGRQNRKLDEVEGKGRASADDLFARIFGTANSARDPALQGPLSVLGMTPEATAAASPPPPDPSTPAGLGDAAMAALGKPVQHDHATHAGTTHADWLKYSNSGATRNDPLDPALVTAMSFLPDLGVTMDVISGGQEAAGEGGSRTGSTRHDHGKSADADFYKDGRKLDWNNPADLPILTEIVQKAKANGVTGIGAGDDYMGAGRFHVGFGAPAVWGAGGKSANAPAWLVEAYNGAPAGSAPAVTPVQGSAAPAPTSAPQIPINELYMALQNPWLSQDQRGLITGMIQEQQQASDPLRQLELRKAEIELAQLENPQPKPVALDTFTGADGVVYSFNPSTGETKPLTGAEQPEPGYRQMTPEEGAARGVNPAEYQVSPEGKIEKIGGGGVTVNNNTGGGPAGLPPDEEALRTSLGKKEGEAWSTYLDAANTSAGTMQDMEMLDELLTMAPQGPIVGRLAGAFAGINSAADAANSVVKRVAPTLRAPGSGATSDIEYEGMLKSLPQLSANPEANRAISAMIKAKAQINIERGNIVARYQNGEISAADARKAMTEINGRSIMTPELKTILGLTAPPQPGSDMSDDDAAYLRSLGLEP